MPNVINPEAIDEYLESFFPDKPREAKLLQLALKNALQKEPSCLLELKALPRNAPDWLKAKWPNGGPYYEFWQTRHNKVETDVAHVADWIAASVKDNDPWLSRVDAQGRPLKLLKIGSLGQAVKEADKAMDIKNQQMRDSVIAAGGTKTADKGIDLGNGFRMVRLTNADELKAEGVCMSHCVGQGAYDDGVESGKTEIYSLRDRFNKPHVTIELDAGRGRIVQVKGKGDKKPIAEYMPYVQRFVEQGLVGSGNHVLSLGNLIAGYVSKDFARSYMHKYQMFPGAANWHTLVELRKAGLITYEETLDAIQSKQISMPDSSPYQILKAKIILQDGKYYDMYNLPKNFYYRVPREAAVTLMITDGVRLPEGFTTDANISFDGDYPLPERLTTKGLLSIHSNHPAPLPKGLRARSIYFLNQSIGPTMTIDDIPLDTVVDQDITKTAIDDMRRVRHVQITGAMLDERRVKMGFWPVTETTRMTPLIGPAHEFNDIAKAIARQQVGGGTTPHAIDAPAVRDERPADRAEERNRPKPPRGR